MGSGKKVTVGYRYYMNVHFAIGHAGVDTIYELRIGDRIAWSGEVTGPDTLVVTKGNLFGGEKREGGVAGFIDIMPGYDDQPLNPALVAAVNSVTDLPVPAYRGISTLFFHGLDNVDQSGTPWDSATKSNPDITYEDEYRGFDIDAILNGNGFFGGLLRKIIEAAALGPAFYWSAMNPYFKPPKILAGRFFKGWYPEKSKVGDGMNPAHIIFECLTNKEWSRGYPTLDIDDASFRQAADVFAAEGMGLSLVWSTQTEVNEFIRLVLEHINCTLIEDRVTGQWRLIPVRDDYLVPDLPALDASNCTVDNFQRKTFSETTNEVVVSYTRLEDGETDTITVQDLANYTVQGRINSQKREYPGITNGELAGRVAQRDLDTLSKPVSKVTLTANRAAFNLYPGQVFRLTWPRLGLVDVVYRISQMNLGTLQDGRIQIEAVEDVFGLPANVYSKPQPIGFIEPTQRPVPIVDTLPFELSYYEVYTNTTPEERAAYEPETALFAVAARKPSTTTVSATLYDADLELITGTGDLTPVMTLTAPAGYLDTVLQVNFGDADLFSLVGEGLCWLGDELIEMTDADLAAGTITAKRGVVDTVPARHEPGELIWMYLTDEYLIVDETLRETNEVISYKMLPSTSQGQLAIASAPQQTYPVIGRLALPYPPGQVRINGQDFPETIGSALQVAWVGRDRTQQLADVIGHTEGNIGPEPGVTYNLQVYGEDDNLLATVDNVVSPYTYTGEADDSGLLALARSGIYSLVGEGGGGGGAPVSNIDARDPATTVSILNFETPLGPATITDEVAGNTWTVNGDPQIVASPRKFGNSAVKFDGSSDHISINSTVFNIGADDFTVECWFRAGTVGSTGRMWLLSVDCSNITIGVQILADGSLRILYNGYLSVLGAGELTPGFHHIAIVRSGSSTECYFDGVLKHTKIHNYLLNTGVVTVGSRAVNNAEYFIGVIDSFVFTKASLYTENFTPATSPPALQGAAGGGNGGNVEAPPQPRLSSQLRVVLEAERDGLKSFQKHDIKVARQGYGYGYGNQY